MWLVSARIAFSLRARQAGLHQWDRVNTGRLAEPSSWILTEGRGGMCGIVAYVGQQTAREILLEGLKRLEYRGYDSSGIAILNSSAPYLAKAVGKVAALEQRVRKDTPEGDIGI